MKKSMRPLLVLVSALDDKEPRFVTSGKTLHLRYLRVWENEDYKFPVREVDCGVHIKHVYRINCVPTSLRLCQWCFSKNEYEEVYTHEEVARLYSVEVV